jgi:Glycosyl transferase family 2
MKATLAFTTSRAEPRLDWVLRALEWQCRSDDNDLELIVVDALGRDPEDIGLVPCSAITRVVATRPKPSPWQGPQRVTDRDWWAVANARNTAIALASRDYIAFLDDRCWPGPRWLDTLRHGERTRASVLAGAYEKSEDNRLVRDHRIEICPRGRIGCGGGWLYGCTLALPLEWLLEVNGLEEGCDGLSGEDYVLGLMLQNRGRRIDYVPDLFVRQERSAAHTHHFPRREKGQGPPHSKTHVALARFGSRSRTEFTPDLRALRAHLAAGGTFPDVDPKGDYRDWFDGQPIREMVPG